MKKKLFLLILVVLAGTFLWYRHALGAVDAAADARVPVTIPEGTSVKGIAQILAEKGAIRSSTAFSLYVRLHGEQASLQAGSFVLKTSMTVPEIVEGLQGALTEEVIITIPEGYTVKDIDALLAKEGLIKPGDVITCASRCDFSTFDFLPKGTGQAERGGRLEGYLFPDTYFVTRADFVAKFFLERLLGTFRKRVVEGLAKDIADSKRSLHQIVTVASLVEEETRTDEERPTIAGILWKRLDGKQIIGVDAAIRYILDKPTNAITDTDLGVDSSYNLRKRAGLPPGPIANPGLASITATLHPAVTDYWYYLHGTDGKVHYAKTNDEHNVNRAKYLQ